MINNPQIMPADYTVYRNDRASRGGGVLIAVSLHIPSQEVSTITPVEMITVKIITQPIFYICSVYIPPNCDASYQQHLITSLHNLPSDHDVIITGDFNSPDICWYSLSAQQPFSKELCDLFFSLNLQQLVNSPTHMCSNTLDIVATNSPDRLHNVKVDDQNKFCISDHYVITFDVATRAMPIRSTETRRVKLYSRTDFLSLDNTIADNLNLSSLQNLPTTTDSLWNSIKSAIMFACQLHVPQITISSKQLPKWFNSETRHLLKFTPSNVR